MQLDGKPMSLRFRAAPREDCLFHAKGVSRDYAHVRRITQALLGTFQKFLRGPGAAVVPVLGGLSQARET
jgi:hypothetical protein